MFPRNRMLLGTLCLTVGVAAGRSLRGTLMADPQEASYRSRFCNACTKSNWWTEVGSGPGRRGPCPRAAGVWCDAGGYGLEDTKFCRMGAFCFEEGFDRPECIDYLSDFATEECAREERKEINPDEPNEKIKSLRGHDESSQNLPQDTSGSKRPHQPYRLRKRNKRVKQEQVITSTDAAGNINEDKDGQHQGENATAEETTRRTRARRAKGETERGRRVRGRR